MCITLLVFVQISTSKSNQV